MGDGENWTLSRGGKKRKEICEVWEGKLPYVQISLASSDNLVTCENGLPRRHAEETSDNQASG